MLLSGLCEKRRTQRFAPVSVWMPWNGANSFRERQLKARFGKGMDTLAKTAVSGLAEKRRGKWKTAKRTAWLTTE